MWVSKIRLVLVFAFEVQYFAMLSSHVLFPERLENAHLSRYTHIIHSPSRHLLPPNLHLPLVDLGLPPRLLRRALNLSHQIAVVLRRTPRLEDGIAQRVLLGVPVLQQREEGCDLCRLDGRPGDGVCGGGGGLDVCGRGHGGGLARCACRVLGAVYGLDAVGECAGFDGACEGQVGAQGVGGPEAQEAGVLLCYLVHVSEWVVCG